MAPEIDWEGLVVAFENRSHKITHFFDRQTGDVVQILDRETDRHAAYAADPRYAALPRDEGERSARTPTVGETSRRPSPPPERTPSAQRFSSIRSKKRISSSSRSGGRGSARGSG